MFSLPNKKSSPSFLFSREWDNGRPLALGASISKFDSCLPDMTKEQYLQTKEQKSKFELALKAAQDMHDVHPLMKKAQVEAIQSIIDGLAVQIKLYEESVT